LSEYESYLRYPDNVEEIAATRLGRIREWLEILGHLEIIEDYNPNLSDGPKETISGLNRVIRRCYRPIFRNFEIDEHTLDGEYQPVFVHHRKSFLKLS
jgi:hypothetical protein